MASAVCYATMNQHLTNQAKQELKHYSPDTFIGQRSAADAMKSLLRKLTLYV